MINPKIEKALNEQLNREMESGYIYLGMAAYFNSMNYTGFEHWMKLQAGEELKHAMKFFKHIEERMGRVVLESIKAPKKEWNSVLHAFEDAFRHEQVITDNIHKLVALAREEKDYATENFLQWFVAEQVEEEGAAADVVAKLKMADNSVNALMMLDSILGKRGE